MQTSLSFCDESNSRFSGVCIWNEAAINGGSAHFCLLGAFPAIGMAEDDLKILLHGAPEGSAVGVSVDDEVFCTPEEISKVIAKDLHGRFSLWEGRKAHSVHFEFHSLRPESKLESRVGALNHRVVR